MWEEMEVLKIEMMVILYINKLQIKNDLSKRDRVQQYPLIRPKRSKPSDFRTSR